MGIKHQHFININNLLLFSPSANLPSVQEVINGVLCVAAGLQSSLVAVSSYPQTILKQPSSFKVLAAEPLLCTRCAVLVIDRGSLSRF